MATCRFCKKTNYDQRKYRKLFMYGPRHYAHADCGMARFGADFFLKLKAVPFSNLPWKAVKEAGLEREYIARYNQVCER